MKKTYVCKILIILILSIICLSATACNDMSAQKENDVNSVDINSETQKDIIHVNENNVSKFVSVNYLRAEETGASLQIVLIVNVSAIFNYNLRIKVKVSVTGSVIGTKTALINLTGHQPLTKDTFSVSFPRDPAAGNGVYNVKTSIISADGTAMIS